MQEGRWAGKRGGPCGYFECGGGIASLVVVKLMMKVKKSIKYEQKPFAVTEKHLENMIPESTVLIPWANTYQSDGKAKY